MRTEAALPHPVACPPDQQSAVLAHECRNVLSSVRAAAQCILACADSPQQVESLARIIVEEVDRAERLASTPLSPSPTLDCQLTTQLNDLAAEAANRVAPLAHRRCISIGLNLQPNLPCAYASPDQIRQVIDNLVINAIEAIEPRCGRILLSTAKPESGQVVHLTVSDTGPGIPAEEIPRVFSRSFSTKRRGTGLGLWIARDIVEANGGSIAVESTPGRGASFTIRLPVAA